MNRFQHTFVAFLSDEPSFAHTSFDNALSSPAVYILRSINSEPEFAGQLLLWVEKAGVS